MKSEKGLVHVLIAVEAVVLVIFIAVIAVKLTKEPKQPGKDVSSTQGSLTAELPAEKETATETEAAETEAPAMVFSDEVEALLADMSIEQQVAQLFIVSPETLTGTDRATIAGDGTKTALANYPVGGILYTGENYLGRTQMKDLIRGTQEFSMEQSGQYLFVVTPITVDEVPMLAAAWNGAEEAMTELVRADGDIRKASLGGLSLMSYIETEEALIEVLGEEELRCVVIGTNQLDAVAMLQSGADMLCVTEDFPAIYEAVLNAVEERAITEAQIHDAAGRVLTQKAVFSEQE